MKRWTVVLLSLLVVVPLVLGQAQNCKEQKFIPIPVQLDVTKIVTDSISNQKLLLGVRQAIVGMPYVLSGCVCDPDPNDVLRAYILPNGPELPLDPNGVYSHTIVPTQEGWHYVHIGATDGYVERQGTWAVYARINRPPVLCGGQP